MSDRAESLRVIRARWSLLAAAGPVLAAAGAPLPFRASVDGVARGVARYDSSSSAGATLAWLDADRAVLSCGDAGWRVAAAPGPAGLLEGGPSWADHVTLLDHRVSAGHYGWAEFWDEGVRLSAAEPVDGAPLPPVFSTGRTAAALGARLEHNGTLFHLVRMSEYEWLDAASWRSAFGGLVPDRLIDESWETVVGFGLTQWTGGGPIEEGGRSDPGGGEEAGGGARRRTGAADTRRSAGGIGAANAGRLAGALHGLSRCDGRATVGDLGSRRGTGVDRRCGGARDQEPWNAT
ncbi:hypothetical protein [Tsukamurella sp. PLM1]|uniref:hypothetical protein n=1 Tax=Tsukamurella sp. PLM1 TaxID=2929795 RepID=UPI0020BDD21B|nr:hypothetical protein [Tsukamurella sp. PLM1]